MDSAFWPTAFGAALGVVAGVLVQYLFNWVANRHMDRRIRRAIAKECTYNLTVLDDIELAFRRFRDAINGDAPESAMTYIPLNRGLHIQVNILASSGRLYEFFDGDNLKRIQNVTESLSAANSDWFFRQLEQRKQALINDMQLGAKAETAGFVDFADGKVREWRSDLVAIKKYFDDQKILWPKSNIR